jgi:predicted porin
VAIGLGPGSNDANGTPIPPFLPQALTATLSDNYAVMLLAKYSIQRLKLYAGYERITYMAPSDPQTDFTDVARDFLCQGCVGFNNTDIINTAFGRNGLGNKILQVMWTGARYSLTDKVDVIAAYYHYTQSSFFGTPAAGPLPCDGSQHAQCAGTFNAISGVVDWQFAPKWDTYLGIMSTKDHGGLANGFLERSNLATTAGLRFRF